MFTFNKTLQRKSTRRNFAGPQSSFRQGSLKNKHREIAEEWQFSLLRCHNNCMMRHTRKNNFVFWAVGLWYSKPCSSRARHKLINLANVKFSGEPVLIPAVLSRTIWGIKLKGKWRYFDLCADCNNRLALWRQSFRSTAENSLYWDFSWLFSVPADTCPETSSKPTACSLY
jgi:hypothetical protein